MKTTNHTIIFVGNPGVGKSSLLNSLIGTSEFKSGISFGQGPVLQSHRDTTTGNDFIDTPGLADINLRKQAAQEISNALKYKEGYYKIVFIVMEEEGRVRPADGVTMKLVLDALPDKNTPYGIVVNKMSKRNMETVSDHDCIYYRNCVACLNEGRENKTVFVSFYPRIESLVDEDNAVHKPEDRFVEYLDMLPSVYIKPGEVKEVRSGKFDEQVRKLEVQLEAACNDQSRMDKEYDAATQQFKEQDEQREQQFQKQIAKMDLQHEESMKIKEDLLSELNQQLRQHLEQRNMQMHQKIDERLQQLQAERKAFKKAYDQERQQLMSRIHIEESQREACRSFLVDVAMISKEILFIW